LCLSSTFLFTLESTAAAGAVVFPAFAMTPAFAMAKRVLYFFCTESEAEDMMDDVIGFTDALAFIFTFNFLSKSYLVIYNKKLN
jgi:hypothetical protein